MSSLGVAVLCRSRADPLMPTAAVSSLAGQLVDAPFAGMMGLSFSSMASVSWSFARNSGRSLASLPDLFFILCSTPSPLSSTTSLPATRFRGTSSASTSAVLAAARSSVSEQLTRASTPARCTSTQCARPPTGISRALSTSSMAR